MATSSSTRPLHLQRTSLVADIGAGTGYFTVRIAKRIPEGKIFAADIEPDMVRYLGERARREHLINFVPVPISATTEVRCRCRASKISSGFLPGVALRIIELFGPFLRIFRHQARLGFFFD